ncbi:YbgA family protein [Pseudomonas sp. SP16.1]|uniref:YbgA family protein n=1 Tax=Pseudomonas sp. SP16.1 TaxID=3458854 RepID=UPI004045607A
MQLSKAKLGISACLLGAEVRFNGGHKRSRLCSDSLAEHFDFVPVCPEVGIGMPVPREPIRLVGDPAAPRAVGTLDRQRDVTDDLAAYAERMAEELQGICGFIFMQQSPSCGLERVKVYQDGGRPSEPGRGIFAAAFCARHPDLPVEEDGRLNDAVLRENFLTRVFAYAEWQRLLQRGLTRRALIAFHSRYKYLLLATDAQRYRTLGRLLGDLALHDLAALAPRYFSELMAALKKCATRGTHSNVLQHLAGYLKRSLSAPEKQEMQQLIGQYREGVVPLVVPLTLLKHHFRRHPDHYVAEQAYLQPHPERLSLRNAL